jgi:hypothetical protein
MGFRLTTNDAAILKVINDCQTLTMQQLITWRWNSPNPAYTRIRQLVDAGYLQQHFITQVAASPIAATRIFTVTQLGAAVLMNTFDYDQGQISYFSPQMNNWKTLQTIIATNNFRVALLRAIAENPEYELVEWRNEAVFRAHPIHVHAKEKTATKRKPLYPDGFFIVQHGTTRSYNFLEADNGTETYDQFRKQLEIYQAYIESGLHQEIFGVKSLNILIVTTTENRCKQLQKLTAQVGGSRRYKFTTYALATPTQVLTAPIWNRIGEDASSRLL